MRYLLEIKPTLKGGFGEVASVQYIYATVRTLEFGSHKTKTQTTPTLHPHSTDKHR